jgi:hypothetical protein
VRETNKRNEYTAVVFDQPLPFMNWDAAWAQSSSKKSAAEITYDHETTNTEDEEVPEPAIEIIDYKQR